MYVLIQFGINHETKQFLTIVCVFYAFVEKFSHGLVYCIIIRNHIIYIQIIFMFCFALLYFITYTVLAFNHKITRIHAKNHFTYPLNYSIIYAPTLWGTLKSILAFWYGRPLSQAHHWCAVQIWIKFTQDKMLYKCLSFSVSVAWLHTRQASLNLVNIIYLHIAHIYTVLFNFVANGCQSSVSSVIPPLRL